MKYRSPDSAVIDKSIVPLLKPIHTRSWTNTVCGISLGTLDSPGASSQLPFRSSPPSMWRYYYPHNAPDDFLPFSFSPAAKSSLLATRLILSVIRQVFTHLTLSHRTSPRSKSTHLACSSSISKQTHFLLTPSSVAVIYCACQVEYWVTLWPLSTKGRPRKPERWRYLCAGWIISPTRHSAFPHCLAWNRNTTSQGRDGSLVAFTRHNAFSASPNSLWWNGVITHGIILPQSAFDRFELHVLFLCSSVLWLMLLLRQGRTLFKWSTYPICNFILSYTDTEIRLVTPLTQPHALFVFGG